MGVPDRDRQSRVVDARRHLDAKAMLVDMDGVLVDSAGRVAAHWIRWAERRGLDRLSVLRFAHGSPSRDVVARFVATREVEVEADWVEKLASEPPEEIALPGPRVLATGVAW